jgi:hypothetical protein
LEGQCSTQGHQGLAQYVQGHFEKDFGLCQGQQKLLTLKLSDNNFLQKLVASMPKRLAEVI